MYFINSRYVLSYQEEDFVKALEMFEEVKAMDPEYARTYLGIAWAYWHRYVITDDEEDLKQCLTNGEIAYQLDPEIPESNLTKGFVHFIRGEYDKAFEKYRSAFEKGPNSHVVCMGIGYSLSAVGLFESAIPFLLKGIELAPLYIFSRTILATCYRGMGEFEKAEAYLKDVLNLNPRNPLCLSHLVKHMIVVGRYEEAEKLLSDLEVVTPSLSILPAHKAQLLAARGEKDKALALDRSAVVYALLGMKDEAVKAMQKDISEGIAYPYLSLIHDPRYKNLRDDLRFKQIVAKAKKIHEEFLNKYGSFF